MTREFTLQTAVSCAGGAGRGRLDAPDVVLWIKDCLA